MKVGAEDHPKMMRLSRYLQRPIYVANGLMTRLWRKVGEYCPTGAIRTSDPAEDIAAWCGWEGDPQELVDALLHAKLLDMITDADGEQFIVVHHWADHCEKFIRTKLSRAHKTFWDGQEPFPPRKKKKAQTEGDQEVKRTRAKTRRSTPAARDESPSQRDEIADHRDETAPQRDAKEGLPMPLPLPKPEPEPEARAGNLACAKTKTGAGSRSRGPAKPPPTPAAATPTPAAATLPPISDSRRPGLRRLSPPPPDRPAPQAAPPKAATDPPRDHPPPRAADRSDDAPAAAGRPPDRAVPRGGSGSGPGSGSGDAALHIEATLASLRKKLLRFSSAEPQPGPHRDTIRQREAITLLLMRVLRAPHPSQFDRGTTEHARAAADATDLGNVSGPLLEAMGNDSELGDWIDIQLREVQTADTPIAAFKFRLQQRGILAVKGSGDRNKALA